MNERRGAFRVQGPFDGSWSGASGRSSCRILDMSRTGCFVGYLGSQNVGAEVVVGVVLPRRLVRLPGVVVSIEPGIGFGVRFTALSTEDHAELEEWLTINSPAIPPDRPPSP